ncbi:MAG TPA: hypothetical protein VHO03_11150 [Ignavibacteriales bacterium]|nr:hypothetical protein [Ignavibacteriales bacterium]
MKFKLMNLLLIVLFCTNIVSGQLELDKRKYVKKLSVGYLYSLDKNNFLSRTILEKTDSIQCISFHNFCWFIFIDKLIDKQWYGRLMAFNEHDEKLYSVEDSLIPISVASSTIDDLDVFKDKLFIKRHYDINFEEGDIGGLKIGLIDIDKLKIQKKIYLERDAWFDSMFEKDDNIFIEVQPMKAKFNWEYLFLFWLPRGTPTKYSYINNGSKILYIFDKSFNLIRKIKVDL